MRNVAVVILFVASIALAGTSNSARAQVATASTQPSTSPADVDPKLWSLMKEIDQKVGLISDLTADFEQEKHTPLLKKPLTSSGTIRVKGPRTLWRTEKPEPTILLMDGEEIRLFYPEQKLMEVYPIRGQLGALAASPLPRLDVLRQFFAFERIPLAELSPDRTEERALAVRMTPINDELREHVEEVRVVLDRESGLIVLAETLDADGDRTVIQFTDAKTNVGLADSDFEIEVPEGTTVTRPLEGMGENPSSSSPQP